LSDILSQAEIEALLNSLGGDGGAPAGGGFPEPAAAAQKAGAAGQGKKDGKGGFGNQNNQHRSTALKQAIAYEVYDFRRPDKFSKDQLRTLQMLHETFARLAGSSLSAYLRTPITIDLISLEQVPYEEYLRSINNSVFTVMSLPPLTGQAVLEMEFGLVFTMIDRMLGGPGKTISRNVLTDIERPLVRQNIERMFQALKAAWEGVVIVNPGIEGMETASQFVQIAPPNDIVVTILFEVKMGGQRSAMSLCIPYLVLKPIAGKLSAQKWFAGSNRKLSPVSRRLLTHQVNRANVQCTIRLGKAKMHVRDFLALKPGDVVKLDQRTADELTMLVGNVPKYLGKPALQGKQLVFSVVDPITE
jgi:flagellar motor switch protein FliM